MTARAWHANGPARPSEGSSEGLSHGDSSGSPAPIPARLNLVLAALTSACAIALLHLASSTRSTLVFLLAVLGFGLVGNTLFALLHEAVHGLLHPSPRLNLWVGRWLAAFFPTGFSLQRGFHLTHHQNNRSALEQFDYLHPGDVRWLKYAQWYSILCGFYWLVTVAGVITYLVVPRALRARALRRVDPGVARQTSSAAYLGVLDELPPLVCRLEILGAIGLHACLFSLLRLDASAWLACYAAFGFLWSSLQYTDHAFSPLDVRDGAWNLRVHPVVRVIFLNYHYHRAHHQFPRTPWLHLGRHVVSQRNEPSHLGLWLEMWRGPRPLPREPS